MESGLTFGQAVEQMKLGAMAQRAGWNGKGMFIFIAKPDGRSLATKDPMVAKLVERLLNCMPECVKECFVMKNARDELVPGWLASQEDMLASDWSILLGE